MDTVNVHEAKTHLSRLLARVEKGEEILIARAGTVVARLVPAPVRTASPGAWRGQVTIAPDFDEPSREVAELFEAGDASGQTAVE